MPARTIVLHIGPHKTGSTALQAFCDRNRSALGRRGVLYPNGKWHAQLGSCVVDNPIGYVHNVHSNRIDRDRIVTEDARYLENLQREIKGASQETVVLSYEGFFSLDASAVGRLHEMLRRLSDRQVVVFYYRAPIPFAVSELSQRYRMGLPSGFDEAADPPVLAYEDKIPGFVQAFGRGNVLARAFDRRKLVGFDVVDDFFAAIGHPQISREQVADDGRTENESISAEAALLARELAKRSPPPMPGNRFFRRYDRILSQIRGARISLTSAERERVLAAAARHSEYLRREFGAVHEESALVSEPESELFQGAFIESMATQLQCIVADLERERAENRAAERSLLARAESLESQIQTLYASNSWKVTEPLRALRRSVRAAVSLARTTLSFRGRIDAAK